VSSILSVQVGLPRDHGDARAPDPAQRTWRTGIFKDPVAGPVSVSKSGLAGDGQASRTVHGGADRAVLAYAASHYPKWREEFPEFAFPYGTFGENLTVSEQDETTVCIGDIYTAGSVRLEASVPRAPCGNISRRAGIPTLLARVEDTCRIGWLFRVLEEGEIAAGVPIELVARPHPDWTVASVMAAMNGLKAKDPAAKEPARALAACPQLIASWRDRFAAYATT
jgi:MOSC domain-containing protein YiiM